MIPANRGARTLANARKKTAAVQSLSLYKMPSGINVIIKDMAQVHISEAEFVRDIASVLTRVQSGAEIVIERNSRPVAILRPAELRRRKLSEIMAALPESSTAALDPSFASDVQSFIDRRLEPLRPPEWD
jgi:antitoxin (DNA-binding transcriptional repressor) of toxin-antitoxin stability system